MSKLYPKVSDTYIMSSKSNALTCNAVDECCNMHHSLSQMD